MKKSIVSLASLIVILIVSSVAFAGITALQEDQFTWYKEDKNYLGVKITGYLDYYVDRSSAYVLGKHLVPKPDNDYGPDRYMILLVYNVITVNGETDEIVEVVEHRNLFMPIKGNHNYEYYTPYNEGWKVLSDTYNQIENRSCAIFDSLHHELIP